MTITITEASIILTIDLDPLGKEKHIHLHKSQVNKTAFLCGFYGPKLFITYYIHWLETRACSHQNLEQQMPSFGKFFITAQCIIATWIKCTYLMDISNKKFEIASWLKLILSPVAHDQLTIHYFSRPISLTVIISACALQHTYIYVERKRGWLNWLEWLDMCGWSSEECLDLSARREPTNPGLFWNNDLDLLLWTLLFAVNWSRKYPAFSNFPGWLDGACLCHWVCIECCHFRDLTSSGVLTIGRSGITLSGLNGGIFAWSFRVTLAFWIKPVLVTMNWVPLYFLLFLWWNLRNDPAASPTSTKVRKKYGSHKRELPPCSSCSSVVTMAELLFFQSLGRVEVSHSGLFEVPIAGFNK